jgi:phosphate starvation-inducible PhoH-like protein
MARKRQSNQSLSQKAEYKPILKEVKPKTVGQARYLEIINNNVIIFGLGPAGSGKTYLAVAHAAQSLMAGRSEKIILVRPAVEAGEKLGFLPGDLNEKINPYLLPLFDSLNDILDQAVCKELIANGTIQIAPLAFMRGRTLKDAVIILDEAQNATQQQMKMFLTRLGHNSKMIITVDPTQNDLPYDKAGGLMDAASRLSHIKGVAVSRLTKTDIVRHPIVQEIVDAY